MCRNNDKSAERRQPTTPILYNSQYNRNIQRKILEDEKNLDKYISIEELYRALMSTKKENYPEANGFTADFLQTPGSGD